MVKFTKTIKVKASTDQVWKIFAHGFNDAHKWMASVSHSYAQTNGESFTIQMTLNGQTRGIYQHLHSKSQIQLSDLKLV